MEETHGKNAPKRIDWGEDSDDEVSPPKRPHDHQKRGRGKGKETPNTSYRLRVSPSVQPELSEDSPAREETETQEKTFHVRRNQRGFGQDGGNEEGLYAQATEELNKRGLGSHPALRKLLKKYQGDVEKIVEDIESWNNKRDSGDRPQRDRKPRRDQRGSSSSSSSEPPKDFPPYVPVVLVDVTNSFVPSCLDFPPQYVHPKPAPKRKQPASRSTSSSSASPSSVSSSSSEVIVSATKKSSSSLNLPAWDADDDLYMDEVVVTKKLEQLRLERSKLDKEIELYEAQIEKIRVAKLN